MTDIVRGACKIKLKNANKKRTVTVRRVIIFFKFLKASIAGIITLLFSSIRNSEGGGDGGSNDNCAVAFFPIWRIRDVYPGSRIRLFSIPDPGSSKNLSILTPKKQKKWFLSSKAI
jgi:hypothetical protein